MRHGGGDGDAYREVIDHAVEVEILQVILIPEHDVGFDLQRITTGLQLQADGSTFP